MKKLVTLLTCLAITTTFSFAGSCCAKKSSEKKAETAQCSKEKKGCSKDKQESKDQEASASYKTACGGSKETDKDTDKSEDKA